MQDIHSCLPPIADVISPFFPLLILGNKMTIKHSFISLTNQLQSIAFSYSSSYIGTQSLTYNHYHPIIQTFPKEKHNYRNQAFTPPIFLLTHSSLTIHLSPPSIGNDRNNQAITLPIISAAQTLLSNRSRAPSTRNKKEQSTNDSWNLYLTYNDHQTPIHVFPRQNTIKQIIQ